MTDVVDTVDADAALWVPLAEAGRQQTPPVSRAAVSKRVKKLTEAGRLATRRGPQGSVLVNLAAYLRAVRDETDPAQDLRNGRTLLDEPAGDGADEPAVGGQEGYHKARARREVINAEGARLDLDERLGRLVSKEDVETRVSSVFRTLRDRLLGMPAGLSERLAAQPDARAVRALLTTEIRRLLESLATDLEHLDQAENGEEIDSDGDERS